MVFNFLRRKSTSKRTPLETADPDRLKVLDIVESYLEPLIIPYPPLVFRDTPLEGESGYTIELPQPINDEIEATLLYVKFKKDARGRHAVVYLSMPQPTNKSVDDLPAKDRLYNWPKYMGPNYRYGPITVMMEDSVEGRWLSMTMHTDFGADYVDLRMKRCIREQGENVTLTGPRPDGMFALGCDRLWS